MKKPVKKAETPPRPASAAKSPARTPRPRPPAYFIPSILLETDPSPLITQVREIKPSESQVIHKEKFTGIQLSPSVNLLLPAAANVIFEAAAIIPSLVHLSIAPVRMESEIPIMAPEVAGSEPREPERGILHLLARDPHGLFATWNFPGGVLEHHRLRSADGCLHLKVHAVGQGQEQDFALTAEACEWFISVQRAGTEYRVELGYRDRAGAWVSMADPAMAATPADVPAAPATAQMLTVTFPAAQITVAADLPWIPEVQAALQTLYAPVQMTQVPEAAHSLHLHLAGPEGEIPSPIPGLSAVPPPGGRPSSMAGVLSLPTSHPPVQPAQPAGDPAGKFWLTVNAELIIYGATEPNAQVEIGGHPIRLRADGGFSFRFALPDGRFELPVAALSADGVEFRGAVLQFARGTQTAGEVGVHPQDPELKKPIPESCA